MKRIADVRYLRTYQFAEDAGPMAHPVRPTPTWRSTISTADGLQQGGEVIRMLRTLLGQERFRRGMDLYFDRHDGQAVRVDDFVQAMADASGKDLGQFSLWYRQAGTPQLDAKGEYDETEATFTLTFGQQTPATPGQPDKQPLHIPLVLGLLDREGREMAVTLAGENRPWPDHPGHRAARRDRNVPLYRRRLRTGAGPFARFFGAGTARLPLPPRGTGPPHGP